MSEALVEVARFNFPSDPDFLLFINHLESEGIPYACPERFQLETQPFLSIGLGGLRVLVHADNLERASALLKSLEAPPQAINEASVENTAAVSNFWFVIKLIITVLLLVFLIYRLI